MPEHGSVVVLVPAHLGGFWCFDLRRDLADGVLVADPQRLRSYLNWLPPPITIVLCGRRRHAQIRQVALSYGDLYVLPAAWLRHLPSRAVRARAELARRIVLTHMRHPIERFCSRELALRF